MKNLIYLSTLFFILFSCGGSSDTIEDNPDTPLVENFKISGTIDGFANETIYIETMTPQGKVSVAQGQTNDDGEFEVIGNVPDMGVYQIRLGETETAENVIVIPLTPNNNLKITANKKDFATSTVFEGTEWAKTLTDYMAIFKSFASKQQSLGALRGQLSEQDLMKKYMELRKPLDEFCIEAVKKDLDNPINILLSSSLAPNMGFENWDKENLTILKNMSAAFSRKYNTSPIAKTMVQQVSIIEQNYNQYLGTSKAESSIAPEIALNNPEGLQIKLSSLKGKYVLIDFWASWCLPCRKENPNVVRLYNQYKDKGFTILSVSLDSDVNLWKAAIKTDGLIWPNHVSDLKGWESSMVKLYNFQSIPHTVLIDKEGKIVETGLRGESLEQKLKELIKN